MYQDIDFVTVLNGIPHAVVLLDRKQNISGMNHHAEALTGRNASDAQGIRADFILRSNLQPLEKSLTPVMIERKTISIDGNVLDRNRKIVPMRFSVSPLETVNNGDVLGAMVVLEDISRSSYHQETKAISDDFGAIASISPKMNDITEQIPVFAGTDASVLIDGETGTGKGSAAETIHKASKRAGYPYIKVNCGALPEALLESELFGHVRGAFPAADRERQGMFRLADHGTIFFSEIGDMPLSLQAKLLTVLDEGEFSPLGSTKKVAVDVRVIAATSRDLRAVVQEGGFREDLYYRLNVLRLHVPPLRERPEDIPLLVDHFIKFFAPANAVPEVDREVIDVLKSYQFPGNVRELRNIVEHAVTLSQGGSIRKSHLPDYMLQPGQELPMRPNTGYAHGQESAGRSVKWDDVEKDMIIDALRRAGGRRKEAARMLGWARSTLYRKLKQHGI